MPAATDPPRHAGTDTPAAIARPVLAWRRMTPSDLPAVGAIADAVHIAYPEDNAIFVERLLLFPAGCLVLQAAGTLVGYLVAHPGRMREPPALNTRLGALPAEPDCLYLHDIAVLPAARGRGAATVAIERLVEIARAHALPAIALIAIAGTLPFWGRHGFTPLDDHALAAKLASYDPEARLMRRHAHGTG